MTSESRAHAVTSEQRSEAEIVLGTHNAKKGRELDELLGPYGFRVRTLAEFDDALQVVEDGTTFAENAVKKATQQAVHLKRWVLAEDSGLVVDALDGAPGIFSARFAGPQASDEDNNRRLLEQMQTVPWEKRTAHYYCHVVLSDSVGIVCAESNGICRGRIGFQPVGSSGFGYDPLFVLDEYHCTFAQLGDAVKSVLSHRARAMRRLIRPLQQFRAN